MNIKAGYSTPILHVADIERSICFYELLGFELIDTDDCKPLGWARIHCEGGALMFLRNEPSGEYHAPALMLCMYTEDLNGLRDSLIANQTEMTPIKYPPYMPSGECYCNDPDGNQINLVHWGKVENQNWLKRLEERKK